MKIYLIITLVIILFSSISCTNNSIEGGPKFEIYLTKNYDLSLRDSNIDIIELNTTPIVSSANILFYDFSAHTIFLKNNRIEIFKDIMDENNYFIEVITPFILIANKQKIYLGYFWSVNSNMGRFNDYCIFDSDYFPSDVINISSGYNFTTSYNSNDLRSDNRILQALKDDAIFRAGINVKLDSVGIFENADTSTVQYRFNLTNNEMNDLFIADPDLMGNDIFNQYTLGVVFKSTNKTYYAEYLPYKIHILENWNKSWYTKLASGESINRLVEVKGYPKIPGGNYTCFFRYAAPTKIENSINADGSRYWLGWTDSDILEIEVIE